MKKFLLFALIGLVMMASFTSCKKDKQDKEFKEKIIGKWKTYSSDGVQRLTDFKTVNEYFADGTVKSTHMYGEYWICSSDRTYKIEGNKYPKTTMSSEDDPSKS